MDLLSSSIYQCTLSSVLSELDNYLSHDTVDSDRWLGIRSLILGYLNTVMHGGQYHGKSALLYIAFTIKGRQLLIDDSGLRSKVTANGLNSLITVGNSKGKSALYFLAGKPEGQRLLIADNNLRDKITADGLNAVIAEGLYKGYSPLLFLAASSEGRQLLKDDEVLRGKITTEGLNAVVHEGEFKGFSTLIFLAGTPEGRQLLIDDAGLRGKITSKGLNSVISEGKYKGYSALWYLASNPKGRWFFINNDEVLRSKISAAGLNTVIAEGESKDWSALLFLVGDPEGLRLLIADNNLRDKITAEGLNHVITQGNYIGYTALYYLTFNAIGLQLLKDDGVLRGKVTPEGLNAISHISFPGTSPLWFLAKNNIGIQLLRDDKVLRGKILLSGLVSNFIVSASETVTWYSVLAYLLGEVSRHAIVFDNVCLMAEFTECLVYRLSHCESSSQRADEQFMVDYMMMMLFEKTPKKLQAVLDSIEVSRDAFTAYFKMHTEFLCTLAKSIDGQSILKTHTAFYPKKMHHRFFAPDIVRNSVIGAYRHNLHVIIDQVTQALVINPAKVTGEDVNRHEYREIYWWLLANGTHPITREVVLEFGQDPDDILVLDQANMQVIKELLKTWLHQNLREKFNAIIMDQDGIDFLLSFSDTVKNISASVLQQSIVDDENTVSVEAYLLRSSNGRKLCNVILNNSERNSFTSTHRLFDSETDVEIDFSKSNDSKKRKRHS